MWLPHLIAVGTIVCLSILEDGDYMNTKVPPDPISNLDSVLGPGNYHRLSREAGLSRSHVTGILKGRRNYTADYVARIADAAKLSTKDVLKHIEDQRQRAKREPKNSRRGRGSSSRSIDVDALNQDK